MGRALWISSSLGVLNAWVGHWLLGSFTEELTPVKTLCCSVRCVPIFSVSTAISALDHASSATREAKRGEGVGREASSRVRVLRLSFLGRISSGKVSQMKAKADSKGLLARASSRDGERDLLVPHDATDSGGKE